MVAKGSVNKKNHVLSCFSAGSRKLVRVVGRMDEAKYCAILKENVVQSVRVFRFNPLTTISTLLKLSKSRNML